ncbi:hypothetical protein [Mariniblastus fucicola]|uniref:Uncharacterized protein n=1 Tax=Mariniblastus fucicola TaxID=980251 RepID=A0A5B9PGS1_9BACT|nr:hypothetical protein [Mariniblastus fucicola]QEG23952.1 hypothetical protein MFFC18_38570 [Mariniblastus fucicola]
MLTKQSLPGVSWLLIAAAFLFVGCGEEVAVEQAAKPLPKLDFHKPESFEAAVARIREIHNAIVSEEALPAPITYTVVEVSHAHGDGNPHVHYHLAETEDHSHEGHDHEGHDHEGHDHEGHDHDGHDHGDHDHRDPFKAEPPRHKVSVDLFTELEDIVRWLPAIASDGDLPQDQWNQANALSEDMTGRLESIQGDGMPLLQRASYQEKAAEMEKCLGELEAIVVPTTSPSKSEPSE